LHGIDLYPRFGLSTPLISPHIDTQLIRAIEICICSSVDSVMPLLLECLQKEADGDYSLKVYSVNFKVDVVTNSAE